MCKRHQRLGRLVPLGIVGLTVFIAIGGLVVKLLWNWLAPVLFGWPDITFLQAVGLLALSRILFGGVGPMGATSSRPKKHRVAEWWRQMTPQERENFRQELDGLEVPPDSKATS